MFNNVLPNIVLFMR